jgi:hypothetical protein
MTVVNLESLVLRGVNGVSNVVVGLERNGSNPSVMMGKPTMPLSPTRHPFLGYPPAKVLGTRYGADIVGADTSASRAGRPGSQAGVLSSRRLAISASRAILSGWSLPRKGACSAPVWQLDQPIQKPAFASEETSGCLTAPHTRTLQTNQRQRLLELPETRTHVGAALRRGSAARG